MNSGGPQRSTRIGAIAAALIGIGAAGYLILYIGYGGILSAALSIGWGGFALLCLYGCANFALLGCAWVTLAPPVGPVKAATFWWGRAIRDSVGDVLPFSQFAGMVIGARAVVLRGVSATAAFGTTVVDITLEMIAQIAFILTGLAILSSELPSSGALPILNITAIGVGVALFLVAVFVAVQRRGFSFLQRLAGRLLPIAEEHAGKLDRVVNEIYAHRLRIALGLALHFLGWLAAALGTWLALWLTGHPLPFIDALAIESVLCAARSAAVFMPAAIGVQEAGYAVMMPLFGVAADIAVAVSLLKRGREIALAVPVLLSWQVAEGRRALRLRTADAK